MLKRTVSLSKLNICFGRENKKINIELCTLIWRPVLPHGGLFFGLSLPQLPYFVRSEGSDNKLPREKTYGADQTLDWTPSN